MFGEFVQKFCVSLYIMSTHPHYKKLHKLFNNQFYDNLPLALIDSYNSYEKNKETLNAQKNTSYFTILRMLGELEKVSTKVDKKKLFTEKMIAGLA